MRGGGGGERITGRKKKRKKQTRVTVPYFLFWTRAMTVKYGDLSDIILLYKIFSTFLFTCGNLFQFMNYKNDKW